MAILLPTKIIVLKYNEILPAVSYHTMNGLALIRIFPSFYIADILLTMILFSPNIHRIRYIGYDVY